MIDGLQLAVKLVSGFEGCKLTAYPDPESPLAIAKAKGLPTEGLSGAPWTIGYGETLNVKEGMVWTQAEADQRLYTRLQSFLARVVGACPQLALPGASPARLAACTSLAYNIGVTAFGSSTVCRMIKAGRWQEAADAFLMWNKAGGKEVAGLTNRRKAERDVFLSA